MEIWKIGRDCIGNEGCLVSVMKGLARGFFHTDLGHGACDDERLNASLTQDIVQLCSVEGAIAEFVNHDVFRFRRQFVNDLDTFQSLVDVGIEPLVSGMAGQDWGCELRRKLPKQAAARSQLEIVYKRSADDSCESVE